MPSSRSLSAPGRRLTTGTGRSGTGPGSPTSPGCWTFPRGRHRCGSSSARNARTPGRSCGSLTSTGTGSPTPGKATDPELRHRRRARCEDRIRNAKDTGLRNLPLKGFAQNQLWCEITAPASQLRRVRASMAHEAALTAGYCRGRQTRSAPTSASSLTPIRPLGCKELPLASGDALSFCGIANVRQHVENHKINACLKITWISGQS